MKFQVEVKIMPHKELLDPQGKAVNQGLHKMGMNNIDGLRIGKLIQMNVDATSNAEAENIVKNACDKLLVNKIMEQYTYTIVAIES
ncbi:MAG: phosphoribosylformylglycinamidine synthase subunit PurS [Chitinophagales bacterium]